MLDPTTCNPYLYNLIVSKNEKSDSYSEIIHEETNLEKAAAHFEKFDYWELLPPELKCCIVKETGFVTRFALMYTSKSNYQIARSVPMLIKSIEVKELFRDRVFWVTVISENGNVKEKAFISYSKEYDGANVSRYVSLGGRHSESLSSETFVDEGNFLDEMAKFIENLLELANYQVDEFTAAMVHHKDYGKDSIFLDKLKVKKKLANTYVCDENVLKRWLDTAVSPLDRLIICFGNRIDPKSYMEHATVKSSKSIRLMHEALRNRDLLELKNENIEIMFNSTISNKGINEFIKRWIDGEGPENFMSASIDRRNASSEILEGIKCKKWTEKFKKENPVLAKWAISTYSRYSRGNYYYIESEKRNNGATLIINKTDFYFLVTGKRERSKL